MTNVPNREECANKAYRLLEVTRDLQVKHDNLFDTISPLTSKALEAETVLSQRINSTIASAQVYATLATRPVGP